MTTAWARRCWADVAARRGVPVIVFGPDLRAGDGWAFNAGWWSMPPVANDAVGTGGPGAA